MLLEAKGIYGWQFTPSYFEIVSKTLSSEVKDGLAAPVAVPVPSAQVDYNLGARSAPAPLVESALYGLYYPIDAITAASTVDGLQAKETLKYFQGLAWPDPVEVFIPGYTAPNQKSECLFFPQYWSGRVSDRGTIGVLPLLGLARGSAIEAISNPVVKMGAERKALPFARPYVFTFPAYPKKAHEDPYDHRGFKPGGTLLAWMVFDGKGLSGLFSEKRCFNFWAAMRRALQASIEHEGEAVGARVSRVAMGEVLPSSPTVKEEGSDLPALISPAIIPNVGWDSVVEYMNSASTHLVTSVFPKNPDFDPITQAEVEEELTKFYGWTDFGAPDTIKQCIESSQELYRRWDDAQLTGSEVSARTELQSMNAVYAGFQWWGMANSSWLEQNETLIKQQTVVAINRYIEDTNRPKRLEAATRDLAFPFFVSGEAKLPKGKDFVNEVGNMTPTGRRFYEEFIRPVVMAGGTPPTMTPEEAEEAVKEAQAEFDSAKAEASPQGQKSKTLTKARNAFSKAEDKLSSVRQAVADAREEVEKYRDEAGDAVEELEKLNAMKSQLSELGVPTDAVDAKIKAAQAAVGEDFTKASKKLARENAAEVKAFASVEITREALGAAQSAFDDAVAKKEAAEGTLEEAKDAEKAVKALASFVFVPGRAGYRDFIQTIRKGYDATGAGTSKSAVAQAFRWFSGSPQATEAQVGRWAAGSVWQEEFNQARAKSAGLGRAPIQQTLGGFGAPSRPPRTVAGPVDVTLMDGTQRKYQAGRPRFAKAGVHIAFEDFAAAYGNEFQPLFDAYSEAYPEREVESGYENLVLSVTKDAQTRGDGEGWVVDVEPVAFFVNEFTPITDVLDGMDPDEVKELPLGITEMILDPDDPFVVLPKQWNLPKADSGAPKKNPDHRYWMVGRGRLVSPDGESKAVKRIGKGTFSSVYALSGDTTDKQAREFVYVETPETIYDKEIIAEVYRQQDGPRNPHLPQIEFLGHTANGRLYRMRRYKMPLRKAATKNWEDYQSLRKCWEEALEEVRRKRGYGRQFMYSGHEILQATVDCAKKRKVKKRLRDALEALKDWSAMYGSAYTFEISPRNVGTDRKGNLVLVDVLFDMEEVAKARGKNTVVERLNPRGSK